MAHLRRQTGALLVADCRPRRGHPRLGPRRHGSPRAGCARACGSTATSCSERRRDRAAPRARLVRRCALSAARPRGVRRRAGLGDRRRARLRRRAPAVAAPAPGHREGRGTRGAALAPGRHAAPHARVRSRVPPRSREPPPARRPRCCDPGSCAPTGRPRGCSSACGPATTRTPGTRRASPPSGPATPPRWALPSSVAAATGWRGSGRASPSRSATRRTR